MDYRKQDLESASRVLLEGLIRARDIHQNPTRAEYCRDATKVVLGAVLKAVKEIPQHKGSGLGIPVVEFLSALDDLDDGKVATFLKPITTRRGRPADSAQLQRLRGLAAATLEVLIRLGINRDKAASDILRILIRYNAPSGNSRSESSPAGTILSWRENITRNPKSSKASGQIERETYDLLIDKFKTQKVSASKIKSVLSDLVQEMYPKIPE